MSASGGYLLAPKDTPQAPRKAPGGESFDSLSPWTPSLNDQREGIALPLDSLPGRGWDFFSFTPVLSLETANLLGLSCVPVQVMVMWVFDAGSVMLSTRGPFCLLARWFWEHCREFVGSSPPLRVLL